jgi:two-component sensor histidine kinase
MSITDDKILMMFEESRNRILSMALIHERLYRSDDFASIDFGDYARTMTDQIDTTYRDASDRIEVRVIAGHAPLLLDAAVPLGLILNELLSNCFKHAFPFGEGGAVLVKLAAGDGRRGLFLVEDNGVGIPETFDARQSGSLGLELVTTLAGQLRGTLSVESPPPGKHRGTRFTLSFPLPDGIDWTAECEEAILDA